MQNYPVCKYQYRDRKNPTLVMCEKKALNNETDRTCHTVTFCQHDGMWHNSREYLHYCNLISSENKSTENKTPEYTTVVSGQEMVITDTVNRDSEIVSHETILTDNFEQRGRNGRRK